MIFCAALFAAVTIESGTRISCDVSMAQPKSVFLSTERPDEGLRFSLRKDGTGYDWSVREAFGGKTRYGTVVLGGQAAPTFEWNTFVLKWSNYFAALRQADSPFARTFRLAIEWRDGRLRYMVDGRTLAVSTPTQDIAGRRVTLSAPKEVRTGELQVENVAESGGRYLPIDISHRFNATPLAGVEAAVSACVDGVPFERGAYARHGADHLDVGGSWLMEGTLSGYEEPKSGSFGGRWAGARLDSPTRFQFRVPQAPVKALHLLAVSDGSKDAVSHVTAVFYKPSAGFPEAFRSPAVPADGKLHHVVIPVDPGTLARFADQDFLEVELTKDLSVYAMYPDPCYHTLHQAGLPSSVRVYAMTAEMAAFEVSAVPQRRGSLFTEGETPSFRVGVKNLRGAACTAEVAFATAPYGGASPERTIRRRIALKPFSTGEVQVEIPVKCFGWHAGALTVTCAGETYRQERPFLFIRRRPLAPRPFDAAGGFMFGFWNWRGAHGTPDAVAECDIMGRMGFEAMPLVPDLKDPALARAMAKSPIRERWSLSRSQPSHGMSDLAKAQSDLRRRWDAVLADTAGGLRENILTCCFAEPNGIGPEMFTPSEFFGETPPPPGTGGEVKFTNYLAQAELAYRIAREKHPDVKFLMPWGDPLFAIPMMRASETLRRGVDGVGVDIGYFDRLPEMQIHQIALHRLHLFKTLWRELRNDEPLMVSVEGPCIAGVGPGRMTPREQMDHTVRAALLLAGYGVRHQFAFSSVADSADYWGEQHYGAGAWTRLPELNPYPLAAAQATVIRHLRTMRFVGEVELPSTSAYALAFEDVKTGRRILAAWTLRGTRALHVAAGVQRSATVYDLMDNARPVKADASGRIDVTLSASPVFIYGLPEGSAFSLGTPDHSDAVLAPHAKKLADARIAFIASRPDRDETYLKNFPQSIRRTPVKMNLKMQGDDLAVSLPSGAECPPLMPFTSALLPAEPIKIPGKAKSLAFEVEAASDWGRLVVVAVDAKGERWYSSGTPGEWNCDDPRSESAFCFDGRRLVRLPLPSNAPYDRFREEGSTTWGAEKGTGDGTVDLPLTIEKVFVERRRAVIVVNRPRTAADASVLLGGIWAEYAAPQDMTEEAIRLDALRLAPPPEGLAPVNPIAAAATEGTLAPVRILSVEPPEQERDGRQAVVSFEADAQGAVYDVWVSAYRDGREAIRLAKGAKSSPVRIRRLRPDTDLYAFVIRREGEGVSRPSEPFCFRLKAEFAQH